MFKRNLHEVLRDWDQELGSTFRFAMPGKEFVVTSDYDLVHHVMKNRPGLYRRVSTIESVLKEITFDGLFAAEGERWKRHRQMTNYAFNSEHIRNFFPSLLEITSRLNGQTEKIAASGEASDIQAVLMRYTADITSKLAFGADMNTLEKNGNVIQHHLDKVFPAVGRRFMAPFPYWRYFKLRRDRELERALYHVKRELMEIIDETRARMERDPEIAKRPTNLLEALIAPVEGQPPLTNDELFANVATILLAGEDTTANTMAWMIAFMLDHPKVQKKMQEEADAVLGDAEFCTEYAQLEKLSYIEAVANETLRLCDITPFHSMEAVDDTVLGGLHIPKGMSVLCHVAALARNADHFSRPEEYAPERWLTPRPEKFQNHNPKATMPFGGGPRFCPGRNLAMLEIKIAMSMLCHKFEFVRPRNAKPVSQAFNFVVVPVDLLVHLRPR